MTHLFLSPHYDDAVYSCGGTIHQLTQQGQQVIIFTLMAGSPPDPMPDTPIVQDVHKRWQAGADPVQVRRAEDQQAATLLGARTLYNELPDCIYRTSGTMPLYPTVESIFGHIHIDDDAVLRLRGLGLAFDGLTALYAPLGVGHHVDHQIVRDWALGLKRATPELKLLLYADYPYTRDPSALDAALAYYHPTPLQAQPITLSEADLQAKIAAMQAYQTQLSTFWTDAAHLAADVRAAFTQDAVIREPYWRVETT